VSPREVTCGELGAYGLEIDDLLTADDVADRAVCGNGTDVAEVDAKDHLSASCETVNVSSARL
jgi:hypothetical protein